MPRFGSQEDEKWRQFECLVSLKHTPKVNLQNGSEGGVASSIPDKDTRFPAASVGFPFYP